MLVRKTVVNVVLDFMYNYLNYLRYFGSGMSTSSVSKSLGGTTILARAMLSVRDTAIATQKVSPQYEQCSCSVPLVLLNTAPFLYDQVADFRPRQTSGVVTSLAEHPQQNTHISNRTHIASVLRVQVLHGVQCNLRCLNGSSNVQIRKHAVSVSCSECLPLATAVKFIIIL